MIPAPMTVQQAQAFAADHGLPFWLVLLFGSGLPAAVYVAGLWSRRLNRETPATPAPAMGAMVELLLAELTRARQMLAQVQPQIEAIYAARLALLDVVGELYAAAIAGRAMVHDLERQLGRAETTFPPLPAIPVRASATVGQATGPTTA